MNHEPNGWWLYCIIENKGTLNLKARGIHGVNPVLLVSQGDFSVLVSEEPIKKYPLMRHFLMAHQVVNEEALQFQPILPIKFCTMAESKDQILEQVLRRQDRIETFHQAFAEVRGRHEYGLRARWCNPEQVLADFGNTDKKVKQAKERFLKLSAEMRHTALIDIGHLVKEALETKKNQMVEILLQGLVPMAVQIKRNKVMGDQNILNAAFLIEQEKQILFDQAIDSLATKYENELQFKYVGPIPPFNFVEIVIHWEAVNQTCRA